MVGGYFCAASFAAHVHEGEIVSKRIASVTAILLRTSNCPRWIEDAIINRSLLSILVPQWIGDEVLLDFPTIGEHPQIFIAQST
jgi:hypothetical protein